MLKNSRIPLFRRDKDAPRQIGNPVLLETTFDANQLKSYADAGHVRNFAARGRAQPPAPSKYPQYSNNSLTPPPVQYDDSKRISVTPTWETASVYSQGTNNNGYDYMPHPSKNTSHDFMPPPKKNTSHGYMPHSTKTTSHDFMLKPTYYTSDAVANPSPPISPILEAATPERYGSRSRSVSPIGDAMQRRSEYDYEPVTPAHLTSWAHKHKRVSSAADSIKSTATTATTRKPVPIRKTPAEHTPVRKSQPVIKRSKSPPPPVEPKMFTPTNRRATMPVSVAATSPTAVSPTAPSIRTSKALPRPPTSVDPDDLVGNLQSQMEDFHVRKLNINRVMADLKKPQPQNPLISDLAMRRELERRIKELEGELYEVTTEEHEIGLKLHRALRRREKAELLEPTTLWVRRVTS